MVILTVVGIGALVLTFGGIALCLLKWCLKSILIAAAAAAVAYLLFHEIVATLVIGVLAFIAAFFI